MNEPAVPDPRDEPAVPDPRDEPAPFGTVVLLTTLGAVAVVILTLTLTNPPSLRFLLFGPVALVVYEVVVHDVWWRRWWGVLPGAVAGLVVYFEGREMLAGVVDPGWAGHIAYVVAWAIFAVVFAVASRHPRTDFTAAG